MKAKRLCLVLGAALLALPAGAATKDIVLPAGTLMTCTLDEPNFSSATVTVGDPFLCHPRAMQMFGQSVFPRGAYLVGHLQADKDPGHFVGKGWLQLSFDRIGLADTDLPLSAKVIAIRGYKVDRAGKMIGHGHATRDTFEWLFPPLWPWKVLSLPARGPRPALKGEVAVTLRLMEDVTVPGENHLSNRLEQGAGLISPSPLHSNPIPPSGFADPSGPTASKDVNRLFPMETPNAGEMSLAEAAAASTFSDNRGWRHFGAEPRPTLFVTNGGAVFAATQYRRTSDTVAFLLTNGALMSLGMRDIDWIATIQINSQRGVRINLRNGVLCNGECAGY